MDRKPEDETLEIAAAIAGFPKPHLFQLDGLAPRDRVMKLLKLMRKHGSLVLEEASQCGLVPIPRAVVRLLATLQMRIRQSRRKDKKRLQRRFHNVLRRALDGEAIYGLHYVGSNKQQWWHVGGKTYKLAQAITIVPNQTFTIPFNCIVKSVVPVHGEVHIELIEQ